MNDDNKHYKDSLNSSVNEKKSSGKGVIDLVELLSVLSRSFKFVILITVGAILIGL